MVNRRIMQSAKSKVLRAYENNQGRSDIGIETHWVDSKVTE